MYEHNDQDPEMYVSFPAGAPLGPESDGSLIADAVARAREQLGGWR